LRPDLLAFILSAIFLGITLSSNSQNSEALDVGFSPPADYINGYPPGWNPLPGPGSGQQPQYIIIYSTANPRINGVPINPGDWIGVFYKNDNGDTITGGAGEWNANGIQFIAYGDYSPGTLPKNGFGYGEVLNWRFFSWTSQKDYKIPSSNVTYENCVNCVTLNKWYPLSFAKVTNLFTNISFTVSASANPGSICEGSSSQLNAAVAGSTAPYTYSWTSNPFGFTSDIKDPAVSPAQTTQYTVTASDGLLSATGSTTVTVLNFPAVNAGSDAVICQGQTRQMNATATGYSSVLWSTSGDGSFNNPSVLNPVYTPGTGDINSNGATLTLTVNFTNPCPGSKTDAMVLSIQKSPVVNAGQDKATCDLNPVALTGTASNNSSVQWTTSGTGTFSASAGLSTNYDPSPADLNSGSVILTLTAYPLSPCTSSVSDFMVLSLVKSPTANAGIDKTTCHNAPVSISGIATGYTTVSWTTSGSGTFTNGSTLTPVYTPSSADVNAGSVNLTLHATPASPCTVPVSDIMVLTIKKLPVASAGADQSGCGSAGVSLSGTASNYSSVLWSTSGTGSFTSPNTVSATYNPSEADLNQGSVNLTLTAFPLAPCTASASDFLVLTLVKLPVCNAGADKSDCNTNPVFLAGTASNFTSSLWSTSGTGTFSSSSSLSTFYFPSLNDLNTGQITLTLSVMPHAPCTSPATDFMLLTLLKSPEVINQPESQTVVTGDDAQFEITATGAEPLNYEWYGPDGIIPDINSPVLNLYNVDENDMGDYYCKVTNSCGFEDSEAAQLSVLIYHDLVIPAGWGGISLYIDPADPLIENLLAPVEQNLTILMNSDGMYWPEQQVNTLVTWDNTKGYAVKFSQPVSLQVLGLRSQSVLTLQTGWNYMPVKSGCDVEVQPMFSAVPQVLYVSDIAGNKVYWPEYGINTLQVLKSGTAYFIKTSETVNITFPACD